MKIKVSVGGGLAIGDVVQWDSGSNAWVSLTDSTSSHWGVICSEPVADLTEGSSKLLALVAFSGNCMAKASRDIPVEGGLLAIEADGVYVDNASSHACGLVSPSNYQGVARPANTLVSVWIR
jgi:hypothetical protein